MNLSPFMLRWRTRRAAVGGVGFVSRLAARGWSRQYRSAEEVGAEARARLNPRALRLRLPRRIFAAVWWAVLLRRAPARKPITTNWAPARGVDGGRVRLAGGRGRGGGGEAGMAPAASTPARSCAAEQLRYGTVASGANGRRISGTPTDGSDLGSAGRLTGGRLTEGSETAGRLHRTAPAAGALIGKPGSKRGFGAASCGGGGRGRCDRGRWLWRAGNGRVGGLLCCRVMRGVGAGASVCGPVPPYRARCCPDGRHGVRDNESIADDDEVRIDAWREEKRADFEQVLSDASRSPRSADSARILPDVRPFARGRGENGRMAPPLASIGLEDAGWRNTVVQRDSEQRITWLDDMRRPFPARQQIAQRMDTTGRTFPFELFAPL